MTFEAFPKIPRLRRDMVITEKLDGTNAAVVVRILDPDVDHDDHAYETDVIVDGQAASVYAQSRKRIIIPKDDNYGFARWVNENAQALAERLGEGRHFGEWWGQGIQRGYGLDHKVFSLFNVHRWAPEGKSPLGGDFKLGNHKLSVVPVLDTHTFDTARIESAVQALKLYGSEAAPGFGKPEGVIVYHTAGGHLYKRLIENDEIPKGNVDV